MQSRSSAAPLAQLVHEKTAGNPFFTIQFLHALADEGLLAFDHGAARWSWDLDRIHAKGYTDNVVELMVGKLTRLPTETQKALQLLACLGNSADIATLGLIRGDIGAGGPCGSVGGGSAGAGPAPGGRLQVRPRPGSGSGLFADPGGVRAAAHLRIGRLLAAHTPPEKRERRSSRSSTSSTAAPR